MLRLMTVETTETNILHLQIVLTAIKTLDCMTSQRAQYSLGASLIWRKLSETK